MCCGKVCFVYIHLVAENFVYLAKEEVKYFKESIVKSLNNQALVSSLILVNCFLHMTIMVKMMNIMIVLSALREKNAFRVLIDQRFLFYILLFNQTGDQFIKAAYSHHKTSIKVVAYLHQSWETTTNCFPTLRPVKRPTRAAGALSRPSAMSSTYAIFPSLM